ncbi:hypothetical protein RhiirB3_26646 [Rhizophagus irregularis]|nr:hypothetical protein RhiirB3_26646 [Rhizophagus irregularis]
MNFINQISYTYCLSPSSLTLFIRFFLLTRLKIEVYTRNIENNKNNFMNRKSLQKALNYPSRSSFFFFKKKKKNV